MSHYANAYQMSACDMFVDVSMAKAYHMAMSRDTMEWEYIRE